MYQCIGPGIESWLADLKPVQVKELKEGFEKMDAEGTGREHSKRSGIRGRKREKWKQVQVLMTRKMLRKK